MLVSQNQQIADQSQAAVLTRLREKIAGLDGSQRPLANTAPICDVIDGWLPSKGLPLGCIHEVKGVGLASAVAFASLLSTRISRSGAILYIAPDRSFYPLGLVSGDIQLEQWLHVSARRSRDIAWTVLEAVRCSHVRAVLAVMNAADLTFCRRLQLAAESSGTTGFLLTQAAAASSVASTLTRWQVSPVKGPPGRGFGEAFWKLELLYCRGGRPGKWIVAWRQNRLEPLASLSEIPARPVQPGRIAAETALAG